MQDPHQIPDRDRSSTQDAESSTLTPEQSANILRSVRKHIRPTIPELHEKARHIQGDTPEQTTRLQTLARGYLADAPLVDTDPVEIPTPEELQRDVDELRTDLQRKIEGLPPNLQAIARKWLL